MVTVEDSADKPIRDQSYDGLQVYNSRAERLADCSYRKPALSHISFPPHGKEIHVGPSPRIIIDAACELSSPRGDHAVAVAPEPILKWRALVRKSQKFFWSCPSTFFGSTSTISRFGDRFLDGQYSLVSFLVADFRLTVPPRAQLIVKVGARPPVPYEVGATD